MNDLFQNPRNQLLLILLLTAFAGGWLWYFGRHEVRLGEIEAIMERNASIERDIRAAKDAISTLGEDRVRAAINAYNRQEAAIRYLLPLDTAAAQMLPLISENARTHGVAVTQLTPAGRESTESYEIDTYQVTVQGSYHATGAFLASLGSLDQIVHVRDLRGKVLEAGRSQAEQDPASAHLVETSFSVHAYLRSPTGAEGTLSEMPSAGPSSSGRIGAAGEATEKPTITYRRDGSSIVQLIHVAGKPNPVEVPVTPAGRAAAEQWLRENGSQ